MYLHALARHLEAIAPLHLAEPWDNVGLLVGDPEARVHRALLAVDATPQVIDEAVRKQAQLLISYHPLTLKGVRRLGPRDPLALAARHGVAVFSPHTALDAAPGGTNDTLADLAGVAARMPLRAHRPRPGLHKLVVYVPPKAHAAVADAMFAAGAGDFGAYSRCSFCVDGHGSFLPGPDASPDEGRVGEQAEVAERRLEVLVRPEDTARVVAALCAAHPYEEPVYDVTALVAQPGPWGQGRVGELAPGAGEVTLPQLATRLQRGANLAYAQMAAPPARPLDAAVRRIAFVAGAGDDLLEDVCRAGADVFVTGELRHHTVLAALAANVGVVLLGHDGSERPALPPLRRRLAERLAGADVELVCSERDGRQLDLVPPAKLRE